MKIALSSYMQAEGAAGILESLVDKCVDKVEDARLLVMSTRYSSAFAQKLIGSMLVSQTIAPQMGECLQEGEMERKRILCTPNVVRRKPIDKVVHTCPEKQTQSRRLSTKYTWRSVNHPQSSKCELIKLKEQQEQPQPEIEYLRKYKLKVDELTKSMMRTCQARENPEPEKKRPQNTENKTPRKTRFTTDYDGTKIPFKKKKEDLQSSLFGRAVVAERVVEPSRLKDRPDSAKLMNLNLASSTVGFQTVYNEPIVSKIPLHDLLNNLQLSKGVTLQSPLENIPPFRSARCGFKTTKALMSDNVCNRETVKCTPKKKAQVTIETSRSIKLQPSATMLELKKLEQTAAKNLQYPLPKRIR